MGRIEYITNVGWVGAIAQTHQKTVLNDEFITHDRATLQSPHPTQNVKLIVLHYLTDKMKL